MGYTDSEIEKMGELKNGEYKSLSLTKGKYTFKGGLFGAIAGAAISMYFRKKVFVGLLLGALAGSVAGSITGKIINKLNKKQENG